VATPLLLGLLVWQLPLVRRVYELSYHEGDFQRLILWRDALELAAQRPFLGIGPGNYLDYTMRYGNLNVWLSSPHGNYQQITAEMGLVGLGFTLWIAVRGLTLGWRLFRRATDPFRRSLAIAATCSLAGPVAAGVLGDFLIPNYHNGGSTNFTATVYSWIILGLLMSLERLERESPTP
jgi:O-antigen ligase